MVFCIFNLIDNTFVYNSAHVFGRFTGEVTRKGGISAEL